MILQYYTGLFILATGLSYYFGTYASAVGVLRFYTVHFIGLYASMILYRGLFHRLRKYPGPFLARFSNIYISIRSVKAFRKFIELDRLHSEYGDVVRVGKLSYVLMGLDEYF